MEIIMPTVFATSYKDVDGSGHLMETEAWLDTESGHLEAHTHAWCTNWVFGFTGSVGLVFLGSEDRPIGHATDVQRMGVDAKGVWFKPSSRELPWAYDIDPGAAQSVQKLLIIQSGIEQNRLNDILDEISRHAGSVQDFARQNAGIIAEVGGLF
jgi:hypothetical protein